MPRMSNGKTGTRMTATRGNAERGGKEGGLIHQQLEVSCLKQELFDMCYRPRILAGCNQTEAIGAAEQIGLASRR
jgi:hypothetical protein